MSDKRPEKGATPSEGLIGERGRIQGGRSGDKIPGFDPAAAPLETDSEAGGARLETQAEVPPAAGTAPPGPNASSHADAMRAPEPAPRQAKREAPSTGPLVALVIVVVVGALLLIIM